MWPTVKIAAFCGLFLLGASVSAATPNLESLKARTLNLPAEGRDEVPRIRADALREQSVTYGVRAGMMYAGGQVIESIERLSPMLDRLFPFQPLALDGKVLPPVIVEARDALVSDQADLLRTADRIYRVKRPGRFFTVAPTWRDFLYVGLPAEKAKLEDPHPQLLPRNLAEKQIWEAGLEQGWRLGREQAWTIHAENFARLEETYLGMLRYLLLFEKGMVSAPAVATSYSLVTGDKKEMAINERVHIITDHAGLETNARRWRPVVTVPQPKAPR